MKHRFATRLQPSAYKVGGRPLDLGPDPDAEPDEDGQVPHIVLDPGAPVPADIVDGLPVTWLRRRRRIVPLDGFEAMSYRELARQVRAGTIDPEAVAAFEHDRDAKTRKTIVDALKAVGWGDGLDEWLELRAAGVEDMLASIEGFDDLEDDQQASLREQAGQDWDWLASKWLDAEAAELEDEDEDSDEDDAGGDDPDAAEATAEDGDDEQETGDSEEE